MPIDPRELANFRHHKQGVIAVDRPCNRCGYNLKGLKPGSRCPECGQPMIATGRGDRLRDTLADAPLQYLRTLTLGLGLMAIGCVAGAIVLYLLPVGEVKAIALTGAGIAWWIGVYIVTAPRSPGPNAIPDAMLDSPRLRLANRIIQSAWIVAGIGWLGIAHQAAWGAVIFVLAAGLLPVIGLLGLLLLAMPLSSLADWAGYSSLGDRFRATAWGLTACGIIVIFSFMLSILAPVAAGLLWIVIVAASAILFLIQIVFLISLLQLLFAVEWSIKNAQFAHDRERRRVDRLTNPDPERFCPQCDYSLKGLSAVCQCPECGWIDPEIRSSHLAAIASLRNTRNRQTPS